MPHSPLHKYGIVVLSRLLFDDYLFYLRNRISIPISPDSTPPPPQHAPCSLGITISGHQYAHNLQVTPALHDYSRTWLVDCSGGTYLIYIAECRGVAGDYVVYRFHGCRDYGVDPKNHASCPYGLLRIARNLIHPSVDIDMLHTSQAFTHDAATYWANLPPNHNHTLILAYPPGYCDPLTSPTSYHPSPDNLSFGDVTPNKAHTKIPRASLESDSHTIRGRNDSALTSTKPVVIVDTMKSFLRNALTLRGVRRGKSGTDLRSQ